MSAAPDRAAVAAAVDHLAALQGLTLDAAWRSGVIDHLTAVLRAAALVAEFPLPDDVEPAPVFRP